MKDKDCNLLEEAYRKVYVKETVDIESLAKQDPREMEGTSSSEESMNTDQNELSLEEKIFDAVDQNLEDISYKEYAHAVTSVFKKIFANEMINREFVNEIEKDLGIDYHSNPRVKNLKKYEPSDVLADPFGKHEPIN